MTNMSDGRRADSVRRRERVLKALDTMLRSDADITVSALARAARVDRTFLYRHCDLLRRVHAAAAASPQEGRIAAVSRASLQTDLANALERNKCLATQVRQLEKRLSEALGEAAWAESGLGRQPTPTNFSDASPCWNRTSPTSKVSSMNVTMNWRLPERPTEN
ncbi:DUF6262 family protein [Streptomyces sp. NPDC086777]|uniref:DUF6262 family protein n=1 Tax=Streptomyces sp. NPDC086777 TaxID=3154866 RepID=UPI00344C76D8